MRIERATMFAALLKSKEEAICRSQTAGVLRVACPSTSCGRETDDESEERNLHMRKTLSLKNAPHLSEAPRLEVSHEFCGRINGCRHGGLGHRASSRWPSSAVTMALYQDVTLSCESPVRTERLLSSQLGSKGTGQRLDLSSSHSPGR